LIYKNPMKSLGIYWRKRNIAKNTCALLSVKKGNFRKVPEKESFRLRFREIGPLWSTEPSRNEENKRSQIVNWRFREVNPVWNASLQIHEIKNAEKSVSLKSLCYHHFLQKAKNKCKTWCRKIISFWTPRKNTFSWRKRHFLVNSVQRKKSNVLKWMYS